MKVLTLAIGEDFRKSLQRALDSKKKYCENHGYEYILGNEQFWDRERPIPWSKIPFLLDVLKKSNDGEYVFLKKNIPNELKILLDKDIFHMSHLENILKKNDTNLGSIMDQLDYNMHKKLTLQEKKYLMRFF